MSFPQISPVDGHVQWAFSPRLLKDGYPHRRDEAGFCGSCGATQSEPHYYCVPQAESVTPAP